MVLGGAGSRNPDRRREGEEARLEGEKSRGGSGGIWIPDSQKSWS